MPISFSINRDIGLVKSASIETKFGEHNFSCFKSQKFAGSSEYQYGINHYKVKNLEKKN